MDFRKGDLFTATAEAIGHGVNTRGVMGGGIAAVFKEKYPNNYRTYRRACVGGDSWLRGGGCLHTVENGKYIFNIASQELLGPAADYGFLFSGCFRAAKVCEALSIETLAIPLIGCGIGGLEWSKVQMCLNTIEHLVPNFQFEVWSL